MNQLPKAKPETIRLIMEKRTMNQLLLRCPKCEGRSTIDLEKHSPRAAAVYRVLQERGVCTARDVREHLEGPNSFGAVRYHLYWLEEHGYVERHLEAGNVYFRIPGSRKPIQGEIREGDKLIWMPGERKSEERVTVLNKETRRGGEVWIQTEGRSGIYWNDEELIREKCTRVEE